MAGLKPAMSLNSDPCRGGDVAVVHDTVMMPSSLPAAHGWVAEKGQALDH
jgi:hypothetical protein